MGRSEEVESIEEVLASSKQADLTEDLLNATELAAAMGGMRMVVPQGRTINRALSDLGFTRIGKVRINGDYCLFWSKTPDRFLKGEEVDRLAVRQFLADGGL